MYQPGTEYLAADQYLASLDDPLLEGYPVMGQPDVYMPFPCPPPTLLSFDEDAFLDSLESKSRAKQVFKGFSQKSTVEFRLEIGNVPQNFQSAYKVVLQLFQQPVGSEEAQSVKGGSSEVGIKQVENSDGGTEIKRVITEHRLAKVELNGRSYTKTEYFWKIHLLPRSKSLDQRFWDNEYKALETPRVRIWSGKTQTRLPKELQGTAENAAHRKRSADEASVSDAESSAPKRRCSDDSRSRTVSTNSEYFGSLLSSLESPEKSKEDLQEELREIFSLFKDYKDDATVTIDKIEAVWNEALRQDSSGKKRTPSNILAWPLDHNGNTLLHFFAQKPVSLARHDTATTILTHLAKTHPPEFAKAVLTYNEGQNMQTGARYSQTPLHNALYSNLPYVWKVILETLSPENARAVLMATSQTNTNVLHLAACRNNMRFLRFLFDDDRFKAFGLDTSHIAGLLTDKCTIAGGKHVTPMDFAKRGNHAEVVEFLQNLECRFCSTDPVSAAGQVDSHGDPFGVEQNCENGGNGA
ncbi:hypothetical protein DFJ77DRAFT_513779 [Powellomyces hirtus]|nr:hypothetical protein DFJ77DRAFT_513779 [Powellomyces hirtus]